MQISWLDFFRDLPVVTLIVAVLWLLLTWERPAVVLAVLLVLCLVLVRALKLLFRSRRPARGAKQGDPAAVGVEVQAEDDLYGMPSGHSTIAFAFFSFAAVHLLTRRPSVLAGYTPLRRNLVWAVTLPLFAAAPFLVAYQRVAARRHTVAQVVVGGAIGLSLGSASAFLLAR
jgi:membrane-associated phospholipid phosphatase